MAPLYGRKPGQPRVGSTSEPTLLPEPTALAHSLIVSARRVNRSRFGVGRDTLLAGPTILCHINTLDRPAGSTRSRRDN